MKQYAITVTKTFYVAEEDVPANIEEDPDGIDLDSYFYDSYIDGTNPYDEWVTYKLEEE